MEKLTTLADVKVVEDSGWKLNEVTSIVQRGISDFDRFICFERELTQTEIESACLFLQENNCPGWTGVRANGMALKPDGKAVYRFMTTWDSSD